MILKNDYILTSTRTPTSDTSDNVFIDESYTPSTSQETLIFPVPERPSSSSMRRALGTLLSGNATQGGLMTYFYSGVGVNQGSGFNTITFDVWDEAFGLYDTCTLVVESTGSHTASMYWENAQGNRVSSVQNSDINTLNKQYFAARTFCSGFVWNPTSERFDGYLGMIAEYWVASGSAAYVYTKYCRGTNGYVTLLPMPLNDWMGTRPQNIQVKIEQPTNYAPIQARYSHSITKQTDIII